MVDSKRTMVKVGQEKLSCAIKARRANDMNIVMIEALKKNSG